MLFTPFMLKVGGAGFAGPTSGPHGGSVRAHGLSRIVWRRLPRRWRVAALLTSYTLRPVPPAIASAVRTVRAQPMFPLTTC